MTEVLFEAAHLLWSTHVGPHQLAGQPAVHHLEPSGEGHLEPECRGHGTDIQLRRRRDDHQPVTLMPVPGHPRDGVRAQAGGDDVFCVVLGGIDDVGCHPPREEPGEHARLGGVTVDGAQRRRGHRAPFRHEGADDRGRPAQPLQERQEGVAAGERAVEVEGGDPRALVSGRDRHRPRTRRPR